MVPLHAARLQAAPRPTHPQVGKGTGQLFRELKKCNRPLWTKLRLESKHSKALLGENGEILEAMSFKDMLIHHVRFVKWCLLIGSRLLAPARAG